MERIVADASVIAKFFVTEIYSDHALRLREALISQKIILMEPSLLEYEVINALKYSRVKKFSLDEIKTIVDSLFNYKFAKFRLQKVSAARAADLSYKYGISFYDATYLVLAMNFKIDMYTADEKLIEKVNLHLLKHIKDFK